MRGLSVRRGVAGVLVLAIVITLGPVVAAAADFSAVAGSWSGYVTYPGGTSEISQWKIDDSGRYSIQVDAYVGEGSLQQVGSKYAFAFERNGAEYSGTLTLQNKDGQRRLVGDGRNPNGPVTYQLTRGGQ